MMMPRRLAQTPATETVTEMLGSGPFRFVAGEYMSGSRVCLYERMDYARLALLGAGHRAAQTQM